MFRCPKCHQKTLDIIHSIDLPADARSDEIAVQSVACGACGFVGAAVYEESRRGAGESVSHTGYALPPAEFSALDALLASCPAPSDSACACAAHRQLNQHTGSGYWNGLRGFSLGESFSMDFFAK